jgi:cytochrome P450
MFQEIAAQQDGMAMIRVPRQTFVFLSHPEHVRHVVQENHRNYSKDAPMYTVARPFLSDGLLVSPGGDDWQRRRRLVQPVFGHGNVRLAMAIAEQCLSDTAGRWRAHAIDGSVLDISAEMTRLTMRIACRSFFGVDVTDESDRLAADLRTVSESTAEFLVRPFPPLSVPTRRNRAFRQAMRRIHEFIDRIVATQSAPATDAAGITAEFVHAADGVLSPRRIRDELIGLFFAGHQSLAHTLAWCWHLLADHPDVRDRLHQELSSVLGDRSVTFDDLPHLTYTSAVVNEAMRLYPVAWIMMRRAAATDEIAGRRIPRGALVTWSPYVGNRHPDLWERADDFYPERFLEQRHARLTPFGLGPRACVAGTFATAEACLILATLAARFDPRPAGSTRPVPEPSMTLYPKGGLPSRVTLR